MVRASLRSIPKRRHRAVRRFCAAIGFKLE